jgi:hypothetical protein
MLWPMGIVMALIVLIGVPVTLWWWKQADKWADHERKRLKAKPTATVPSATVVSFDESKPPPA